MKKNFCDKCGKETEKLIVLSIWKGYGISSIDEKGKYFELCKECYNEAIRFLMLKFDVKKLLLK